MSAVRTCVLRFSPAQINIYMQLTLISDKLIRWCLPAVVSHHWHISYSPFRLQSFPPRGCRHFFVSKTLLRWDWISKCDFDWNCSKWCLIYSICFILTAVLSPPARDNLLLLSCHRFNINVTTASQYQRQPTAEIMILDRDSVKTYIIKYRHTILYNRPSTSEDSCLHGNMIIFLVLLGWGLASSLSRCPVCQCFPRGWLDISWWYRE